MVNSEYIERTLRRPEYNTLAILTADGKNHIAYRSGTKDELIEEWNEFERNCGPGRYMVKIYHDVESKGVNARYDEKAPRVLFWEKTESITSPGRVDDSKELSHLRAEIDRLRHEAMQKDFEEKLRKIEESSQNRTADILEKMFFLIQAKVNGRGNAISGTQENETSSQAIENDNREILETLAEWQKVDPDFFEAMTGVVKMAKTDPDQYRSAKSLLKNG